jgi:hypothetical protein
MDATDELTMARDEYKDRSMATPSIVAEPLSLMDLASNEQIKENLKQHALRFEDEIPPVKVLEDLSTIELIREVSLNFDDGAEPNSKIF